MLTSGTAQADLTDDRNKVFLLLKSNAIGTQLALFWAARCSVGSALSPPWIMFTSATAQADLTDDPNKVFLLLKTNAIGTQLALFWAAWAYVLELDESYSGAAVVLAEGKAR